MKSQSRGVPPRRGWIGLVSVAALAMLGTLSAAPALAQEGYDYPEVPFVPTAQEVVDEMLRFAEVKNGDVVYDLGCGDGRIVITAAKKFGAKAVGVDIDPQRIKEATDNAKQAHVEDRTKFIQKDLFEADISEASVVTLYLLPSVNLRLMPKLRKELKPGSRVVSHTFDMGDWKPDKEEESNGRRIYLWIIPKPETTTASR